MEKSPVPLQESSPAAFTAIRLVATDMDGTLTQAGKFTPELLRSLTELAAAKIPTVIVTGRSAGWVQGIAAYLPVVGAIAENGGVWIPADTGEPVTLVDIPAIALHRDRLAHIFAQLQATFPDLQPSADNQFRLTDWTFDIGQLTPADLTQIDQTCQAAGWGFTYSTVQCHIRLAAQDKGIALQRVWQQQFPKITANQVVTVGDSPNDEGLFETERFPVSVGVANVQHYCDRLRHQPQFITAGAEVEGFQELAQALLRAKSV
ncbi:MAG: HAD family hydrolase [Cyanobacteria bacterium P01_D01_bin.115]